MGRKAGLALLLFAVAAGAALWFFLLKPERSARDSETARPIEVRTEVIDFIRDFDRAEIRRSDPKRPPLQATPTFFDPEKRTRAEEEKKILWAHPDCEIVFHVDIPKGARLEAAPYVFPAADVRSGSDPGAVIYSVAVDGEEVFSLASDFINQEQTALNNPYSRLIHKEWIDLSRWAGRKAELSFRTRAAEGMQPKEETFYCWWDLDLTCLREIPRHAASPRQPNVLVLCVDALRRDHLGCYGYGRATSPNLDALAERSLVFERAFSACSWTLPATASLLTGLYPNTHGVLGNTRNYLVDGITTMAEYLGAIGVSCAAFSANPLVCAAINFNQGFERFEERADAPAGELNEALLQWIRGCGRDQFFAYVHYMEPHSPYSAPGEFRQHFDPDYREERDFSGAFPERWRLGKIEKEFTKEEFAHLVNLYDSEIYYFDFQLGKLLEALEAAGVADRTILIVTADHGEEFFDHGGLGHGLTLYDEVLSVPLIVFDPRAGKGARIDDPVSTVGLFATVASLAGYGAPEFTQAGAFLPQNEIPSRYPRIFSFTDSTLIEERWASCVEWPYKLIFDVLSGGKAELYDLEKDPREKTNLLESRSDESGRLKEAAIGWYTSTAEAFPEAWQPPTPKEVEEIMKRIGYLK